MTRKHKYQFVEDWTGNRGGQFVAINHSRYGEQSWVLRETTRDRFCDGTGKLIERDEACYSLLDYDKSPNRKARLSVEFVAELKANSDKWL